MAVSLSLNITQNSQSVANNTSNITVKLTLTWSGGSYNRINKYGYVVIDGTKYEFYKNFNWYAETSGSETLYTKTLNVSHNADGTKNVAVSAYYESGVSSGNIKASASKTLTKIPRQANITSAPNFNDEGNPVITYNNSAGNSVESLQACIADSEGKDIYVPYRDISKTGTSYTFNLTTSERDTLRAAIPNAKSMTVKFYVKTIIGGNTYYSNLAKTFSIVNGDPTLSPKVVDTNQETIYLTNDANILINGYSNAAITFGAAAVKKATLKKTSVINGSQTLLSNGTINKVDSGTFVFTATDSRGLTTTQTVEKTFVNYVKLTCNFKPITFTVDGNITFKVNGNYYSGFFGSGSSKSNKLSLLYRYKVANGEFGEWITIDKFTANASKKTYDAEITYSIPNFNYKETYTFQVRAFDLLETIDTAEYPLTPLPIFDWGRDDFNFNVPVSFSEGITDGSNTFNILGLCKAISNTYQLNTTFTAGANYISATGSDAVLLGNNLRCYVSAKRKEATGTGNVANEVIATLTINHGGKIKSMYATNFSNGSTGGLASFTILNAANLNGVLTFDVSLCATGSASNEFSTYFILPVSLNLDAY